MKYIFNTDTENQVSVLYSRLTLWLREMWGKKLKEVEAINAKRKKAGKNLLPFPSYANSKEWVIEGSHIIPTDDSLMKLLITISKGPEGFCFEVTLTKEPQAAEYSHWWERVLNKEEKYGREINIEKWVMTVPSKSKETTN